MRNIKRTILVTVAGLVMGVSVMAGTASADGIGTTPSHMTRYDVDNPIFSVEEAKRVRLQNQPFTPH